MLFRSISGLPSCLRSRQALHCPPKFILRQAISYEPPVSRQHSSDSIQFGPFVEEPNSAETRWITLDEPKVCSPGSSLNTIRKIKTTRKSTYSHISKNETSFLQPDSPPGDRIGQTFESSDFIEELDSKQGVSDKNGELDWTAIHDKFLDIRREAPDQTATVFRKEMLFASQFIGEFSHNEVSLNEFRHKWKSLSVQEQDCTLPKLLIGSLAQSASQILFVLAGVNLMRRDFRVRMNCLRSIGLMYREELQKDPGLKSVYETQIDTLRSPESWPRDKLPAVLLQNLLFWSSPDECQTILENFSHRWPDAEEASMAIIDHYLRIEDRENAFDYLKRLPEQWLRNPDANVKELRDRLLKLDVVTKSDDGASFKYLPQVLALGMPSDEALHNTVIESAVANGLPDVAWDVYKYLEESQFKINARAHLVLLRDAFARGTLPKVNTIMTAIHQRRDLTSDPYLVSFSMNIIRVICCYERKINANEALAHIMALYDRAYDRSPLVKLQITGEKANNEGLPQPSPISLAFTIWTYILVQRNESEVLRLWGWIKYLISTGDEAIVDAARFDVIYNGLMLFHARKGFNLNRSLEVMQYMLWNDLCLPTLRTWSILLCSFLRHGQDQQAQRVLGMMQQKGFTVQDIVGKYSNYLPTGLDLENLAKITPETLDETQFPETVEQLLSKPEKLCES